MVSYLRRVGPQDSLVSTLTISETSVDDEIGSLRGIRPLKVIFRNLSKLAFPFGEQNTRHINIKSTVPEQKPAMKFSF